MKYKDVIDRNFLEKDKFRANSNILFFGMDNGTVNFLADLVKRDFNSPAYDKKYYIIDCRNQFESLFDKNEINVIRLQDVKMNPFMVVNTYDPDDMYYPDQIDNLVTFFKLIYRDMNTECGKFLTDILNKLFSNKYQSMKNEGKENLYEPPTLNEFKTLLKNSDNPNGFALLNIFNDYYRNIFSEETNIKFDKKINIIDISSFFTYSDALLTLLINYIELEMREQDIQHGYRLMIKEKENKLPTHFYFSNVLILNNLDYLIDNYTMLSCFLKFCKSTRVKNASIINILKKIDNFYPRTQSILKGIVNWSDYIFYYKNPLITKEYIDQLYIENTFEKYFSDYHNLGENEFFFMDIAEYARLRFTT